MQKMNPDQIEAFQRQLKAQAQAQGANIGRALEGLQQSAGYWQAAPETPLMFLSMTQLHQSISELDSSVDWLIQKIQPVCQAQGLVGDAKAQNGQQIETTPSSLRADILQAKAKVERISQTISSVRYLIEI